MELIHDSVNSHPITSRVVLSLPNGMGCYPSSDLLSPPLQFPGRTSQHPLQLATSPRHEAAAALSHGRVYTVLHHSVEDATRARADFTWVRILEVSATGAIRLWADHSVFWDNGDRRSHKIQLDVIDGLHFTANGTAVLLGRNFGTTSVSRIIVGENVVDIPASVTNIKITVSGEIVYVAYPGEDEWYEQVIGPVRRRKIQPARELSGIGTIVYDKVLSFRWYGRRAAFCTDEDGSLMLTEAGTGRWLEVELDHRVNWVSPSPRGFGAVFLADSDGVDSGVLMWDKYVLARGALMLQPSDVRWSPDGSVPVAGFQKLPIGSRMLSDAISYAVTPNDRLEAEEGTTIREPIVNNDGKIIAVVFDTPGTGSTLHLPGIGDVSTAQHIWNLRLDGNNLLTWNSIENGSVHLCTTQMEAATSAADQPLKHTG